MTKAWTTPAVADVEAAYPNVFVNNQNDELDFDPTSVATAWLPQIVAMVIGAIGEGNRVPLSLTAGAVPPEAVPHVYALVAEQVVVNNPRLGSIIVLEGGENGVLGRSITAARTFLEKLRNGLNATIPIDPDPANLPTGTLWGDYQGAGTATTKLTDMTTDGLPLA